MFQFDASKLTDEALKAAVRANQDETLTKQFREIAKFLLDNDYCNKVAEKARAILLDDASLENRSAVLDALIVWGFLTGIRVAEAQAQQTELEGLREPGSI